MKFARVALSALGGVALMASSALAADIAAVAPPPVWGFYFGGGGCYDWADFDFESQTSEKHLDFRTWKWTDWAQLGDPHMFNVPAEAPCLTATFGYDVQIDPLWVVGVFASYDWQDKHGDETKDSHHQKILNKDLTLAEVSLGDIMTVGGRAGMLVTPKVLVYGLFGWSWSQASFALLPPIGPAASGGVNGPTIGAGIEALFHRNWSGRVEYRLTDFGSLSGSAEACVIVACFKEDTTAKITDQSVRLVLTYRP